VTAAHSAELKMSASRLAGTPPRGSPTQIDDPGISPVMREAYTLETEVIKNKKVTEALAKENEILRRQIEVYQASQDQERARSHLLEQKLATTLGELTACKQAADDAERHAMQTIDRVFTDKRWLEAKLEDALQQLREFQESSAEREKADSERMYMLTVAAEEKEGVSTCRINELMERLMSVTTREQAMQTALDAACSNLSEREQQLARARAETADLHAEHRNQLDDLRQHAQHTERRLQSCTGDFEQRIARLSQQAADATESASHERAELSKIRASHAELQSAHFALVSRLESFAFENGQLTAAAKELERARSQSASDASRQYEERLAHMAVREESDRSAMALSHSQLLQARESLSEMRTKHESLSSELEVERQLCRGLKVRAAAPPLLETLLAEGWLRLVLARAASTLGMVSGSVPAGGSAGGGRFAQQGNSRGECSTCTAPASRRATP
jgi:hypothetical protein